MEITMEDIRKANKINLKAYLEKIYIYRPENKGETDV